MDLCSASYSYTCGLAPPSTPSHSGPPSPLPTLRHLRCWGSNQWRTFPQTDLEHLVSHSAQSVSVGRQHTCVLSHGSFLHCWGHCAHGQCDVPNVQYKWITVKSGGQFTCAVEEYKDYKQQFGVGGVGNTVGLKQNFENQNGDQNDILDNDKDNHLVNDVDIKNDKYKDDNINKINDLINQEDQVEKKREKLWCIGTDFQNIINETDEFEYIFGDQIIESINAGYAHVCAGFKQNWRDKWRYQFWRRADSNGEFDSDEDNGENFDQQPSTVTSLNQQTTSSQQNSINQINPLINTQTNININSSTIPNNKSNNQQSIFSNNYKYIQWQCWGSNNQGQNDIPQEINHNQDSFTDQQASRSNHIRELQTGYIHTCSLSGRGRVICFGNNMGNQNNPPVHLTSGLHKLTLGFQHSCGLRLRLFGPNEVGCWGSNSNGESKVHSAVEAGQTQGWDAVDLCAGQMHTCAVNVSGVQYCWGLNDDGQCSPGRESGWMV